MQATSNNCFLIVEWISVAANQAQSKKEQWNTIVEKVHLQVENETK